VFLLTHSTVQLRARQHNNEARATRGQAGATADARCSRKPWGSLGWGAGARSGQTPLRHRFRPSRRVSFGWADAPAAGDTCSLTPSVRAFTLMFFSCLFWGWSLVRCSCALGAQKNSTDVDLIV